MTTAPGFRPQDLEQHAAALRRLARGLLADRGLADDVVQQAFIAAIERPPHGARNLRAWLARVVRSRAIDAGRSQQRRRERERTVARSEAHEPPETGNGLARQETVLRAVRSLHEPYRTAIYERYYEDRKPREIAARHGIPVKTVRTRLWRGLDLLRARLDAANGGDRRAWMLALVPLVRAGHKTAPAALTLLGVLAMNVKTLALALVGASLIAGIWWAQSPGAPAPAPDPQDPRPALASGTTPSEEGQGTPQAAPPKVQQRVAAEASEVDAPPYGSLVVRAIWESDKTPAADVGLILQPTDHPQMRRHILRVRTDADGIATIDRIHAGKVTIQADRGAGERVSVTPGQREEIEFIIARGVDVRGLVVDGDDRPVAGARIWLTSGYSDWLGGNFVATSGADGRFSLRDAPARQSLGARARGFAPTALVDLQTLPTERSPVQVTLRLDRAGLDVTGKVVDQDGRPVHGALVAFGERAHGRQREDRTMREVWTPLTTTTRHDGTFRCEGLEPGTMPVQVRAAGFPLWLGEVHGTAGSQVELRVPLEAGATLSGIVVDEAGKPVEGARITANDRPFDSDAAVDPPREVARPFEHDWTTTDAEGRFELPCLAPGTMHLHAMKGSQWINHHGPLAGSAQTQIEVTAGERLQWNPTLSLGLTIRGYLVDANGKRLHDVMTFLQAKPERDEDGARHITTSSQPDGSFLFAHCRKLPYTLSTGPTVYKTGVWPGESQLVLQVDWSQDGEEAAAGVVTGRIADLGQRLDASRSRRIALDGNQYWGETAKFDGDRFRCEDVPPGSYRLKLVSGESTVLSSEKFDVAPGEHVDLGILETTQPGALTARVRGGSDIPGTVTAELFTRDKALGRQPLPRNGNTFHNANLEPGRYRLALRGETHSSAYHDVEIRPGQTCEVDIDLRPTIERALRLKLPKGWQSFKASVRGATGASWARFGSDRPFETTDLDYTVHLPLGTFTLVGSVNGGTEQSLEFSIDDLGPSDDRLEFELR